MLTVLKKLLVAVAVGNYFFTFRKFGVYYLLYFQAKAGRLVFSKGMGKTFIKRILFIQIKPIV